MSGRLKRLPVVVPVLLGVLILGGCRDADRAALPADAPAAPVSRDRISADPLRGIEAAVDTVERDVDADAGSDGGSGADPGR